MGAAGVVVVVMMGRVVVGAAVVVVLTGLAWPLDEHAALTSAIVARRVTPAPLLARWRQRGARDGP